MASSRRTADPIPARAGIGLRGPPYRELRAQRPALAFLEVHSENYFGEGGAPLHYLERLRAHYPVSLHGVGLSLGSTDPVDEDHLTRLASLIDRFEPALVSEHLCWSSIGGRHLNDLLPLPYTEEALAHVVARIVHVQERLKRRILIENLSSYVTYEHSHMPEWDFLSEVASRADCGILLDVNNVYVSSCNHGFDPRVYLASVPPTRVGEIHLAGFTRKQFDDGEILIDTHNTLVSDAVWELYGAAVACLGPRPTLLEWDSDLPPLSTLLAEAAKADAIAQSSCQTFAACS